MIARKMRTKDLSELLRNEIVKLKSGTPILSAKEIAHKYNISVLTAHRALKTLADEGLIDRVIGSGSFVADRGNEKKSYRIGVSFAIYPKENRGMDVAFNIFHSTIVEDLRARGHEAVYLTYNDLQNAEYMSSTIKSLDGLILTAGYIDAVTVQNIAPLSNKTVLIQHTTLSNEAYHQVLPDLYSGYCTALEQVIGSINGKIYSVAFSDCGSHRNRINTFYAAAQKKGISPDMIEEICEAQIPGDDGWRCGIKIAEKLLSKEKPFIVSVSDFISFGIIDTMMKNGRKPGVDFRIVSFDDLEGAGFLPFGKPVLASITFPKREISQKAVSLLMDILENPPANTIIYRVPTSFIPRKTTEG